MKQSATWFAGLACTSTMCGMTIGQAVHTKDRHWTIIAVGITVGLILMFHGAHQNVGYVFDEWRASLERLRIKRDSTNV